MRVGRVGHVLQFVHAICLISLYPLHFQYWRPNASKRRALLRTRVAKSQRHGRQHRPGRNALPKSGVR